MADEQVVQATTDAAAPPSARAAAVLRDVIRSGGTDRWGHLHSHGHHWHTVQACVRRGWLEEPLPYWFNLTDAGRRVV